MLQAEYGGNKARARLVTSRERTAFSKSVTQVRSIYPGRIHGLVEMGGDGVIPVMGALRLWSGLPLLVLLIPPAPLDPRNGSNPAVPGRRMNLSVIRRYSTTPVQHRHGARICGGCLWFCNRLLHSGPLGLWLGAERAGGTCGVNHR